MLASTDDRDFKEIYRKIPVGITITAATLDHFETLRSFCFSLKGAAIGLGSNAMFFLWHYSKRNWTAKGLRHFGDFVEKHKAGGAKMFIIDQPTGWIDTDIAKLIGELALKSRGSRHPHGHRRSAKRN